ncbi:uncharacterized protein LOC133899918 [Phragmites australis]|uniref:uncharacterized protein LOC133899918 n=1 Tax=Phragmites australis TaxID=29695 RepID=UPI002D779679|nr:uncharacterized protein LOC133899918 [Phragmites australis]
MVLAGNDDNAPTTAMLVSYRASTPSLADHLVEKPRQRVHCLGELPLWRRKTGDGQPAGHVTRTVDWSSVLRTCKEWLKNPMNIALLLWLLCVAVSGGMLVLLLLGLLDGVFPAPAARNRLIEINNQLLNALFTLMSLYQHPALCHHLFLLCRWRPHDAAELRAAYCKDGAAAAPRPGERAHMSVVVALLHLTAACQYVLCGLYWGYTKSTRPELAEDGFFVLGVAAPVVAAVYTVCSPLGKAGKCELACSDATGLKTKQLPTPIGRVVVEPEWAGGMFDCTGDAATGCLSLSCTFCVFGWNMERLGLGNRYVHAVTFVLLCFAPLWVFGISALHIHNYIIGDVVGGAGLLLCACGLLYGGYWRIQMRKRFGLPGSRACCGSKSLTDYARWLFCWPCALAQEVRTASLYHVDGESFYTKVVDDDHEERQPLLVSNHHDVFRAPETVVAVSEGTSTNHLVVVHGEMMVPPNVQVVAVKVEDDKSDECTVVHGEMVDPANPMSASVREEDESLVEDADHSISSDGSWRVEKVKKLINMVTLLSLLILLYTRGFIH